MTAVPEIHISRATSVELMAHLQHCDAAFVPPLSQRVNLEAYAAKLVDRAMRIEAWDAGALVGLVAAYCNDPQARHAFITNVSVLPAWQGEGLAGALLEASLQHLRDQCFSDVELEVDRNNGRAVAFYRRHRFGVTREDGATLIMTLPLAEKSSE